MAESSENTTISNSQGKKFWKKVSDDPSSGVTVVNEKLHLVIPPYYLDELKKSVTSVIDCRLIRYQKELGGILAGYGNLVIKTPKADLLFDLSNIHVDVEGDFYIFNPEVNKELTGIVNRKTYDHIGCLVHGLFNISLPKPFSVNSEDWSGKPARLKDKVRFTITRVDLLSVVPYIEGRIIELIPNVESDSEVRQRTSSDSGVSIASEESMNIAITPEENMDRKKSKLSLSLKKKVLTTVADEVNDEINWEDKKRKRNISEGSNTQETPRNKKAKPSDNGTSDAVSEDVAPVENLTTNLFTKFSEKLDNSPTPSRNLKSKLDTSTNVQASVETERNPEPNMVIVPEDLSQRLIKELSSSKKVSKKRKMGEDSDSKESVKSPEKTISKPNVDIECEPESNSDEDLKISRKIPSSQKKSNPAKKMDVISEKESSVQVFKSPLKTPSQSKLAKKLNVESEKEDSCSDQDFVISQKTPVSSKKSKLAKKSNVEFEKVSSCSDQDFVISQKTPVSSKKSKLTKKLDVESEKESSTDQDFTALQNTPVLLKKVKTPKIFEKESSSDDFESSQKTPSSLNKSKLTKSNNFEELFDTTPAKKTPAKKTSSTSVKEASLKKSKNIVETNFAVTPGKQSKKITAVVDSDPESDKEFLIQELLNSSRIVTSSNSTPSAKTSKMKQTPLSKIKQVEVEKKSKTPISSSVSSQVKETDTPSNKNAKESLSGKSLKALASDGKQEAAETDIKVFSSKKTPTSSKKPFKIIPGESVSNVSSNEKKIRVEPAKKRTKLKKKADEEANSEEDILSEILKTVQPKEKKSKTKTNTANS